MPTTRPLSYESKKLDDLLYPINPMLTVNSAVAA